MSIFLRKWKRAPKRIWFENCTATLHIQNGPLRKSKLNESKYITRYPKALSLFPVKCPEGRVCVQQWNHDQQSNQAHKITLCPGLSRSRAYTPSIYPRSTQPKAQSQSEVGASNFNQKIPTPTDPDSKRLVNFVESDPQWNTTMNKLNRTGLLYLNI